MGLFSRRQVEPSEPASLVARVTLLEAELLKTQAAVRSLETEQLNMHDQVRRWMRRAVAAERVAERASDSTRNPATVPAASLPELPVGTPLPLTRLTGVRARRLARAMQEHREQAAAAAAAEANGGE